MAHEEPKTTELPAHAESDTGTGWPSSAAGDPPQHPEHPQHPQPVIVKTGGGFLRGLFFATAIVCLIRGTFLWGVHFVNKARVAFEAEQRAKAEAEAAAPPVAAVTDESGPAARPAAA